MKKTLFAVFALSLVAFDAHAISRHDIAGMSCSHVQGIVRAEGAAILRYPSPRNPSLTLYDRFVAHGGYCQIDEEAVAFFVPTADTASCAVLKCQPRIFQPFGDD
ncbi:MAG: hypothetical protein F9K19_25530 [Rhizobiaceae bacterium]|nr:MAG: hypothetical protein F9K19_25530 [Rhizobiaceae bacterium]CAG0977216.1 hypothetical protein RHIZO_01537 [Rhizobiaceae bacterium]